MSEWLRNQHLHVSIFAFPWDWRLTWDRRYWYLNVGIGPLWISYGNEARMQKERDAEYAAFAAYLDD